MLHNEPYAAALSFDKSRKPWRSVIVDVKPLTSFMPDMHPKGIWFCKSTDRPDDDCNLALLISGKQQIPNKAVNFDLCKEVDGILITPRYSRNRVDFDLQVIYSELQE